MSPEQLRQIRESARRATRDAREATTQVEAAGRRLGESAKYNDAAHEEMIRRVDRARRA